MDSNLQQQRTRSGLTRYSSAPSSYFSGLLSSSGISNNSHKGDDDLDHFINSRVSNRPDFSRFMANLGTQQTNPMDFGLPTQHKQRNDYAFENKLFGSDQSQEQQQGVDSVASSIASGMDNSYRLVATPINQDHSLHSKMGGGGGGGGGSTGGGGGRSSSLIRHSSSPAGLFDQINIEFDPSNWFKKEMGFSSLGEMAPISETAVKHERKDDNYITNFQDASWDDSSILSDEFLKGLVEDDTKMFSSIKATDSQNRPPNQLTHHLSLPTSTAELSALEKYSEETVLCKIRAKRGCATHPRSIAERVRRTKISERMRKLQELVPNMDKQTNTSDMLDLAVDYIKDLEKQRRALQENREKCTCSNI